MPADTTAQPRQLLGRGQDRTPSELDALTQQLRRTYTPAVHCLWHYYTDKHRYGGDIYSAISRLAAWVDNANHRIAADSLGGDEAGSRDPSGLPIPKLCELRADAENCAGVIIRRIGARNTSEALRLLRKVLEEIGA